LFSKKSNILFIGAGKIAASLISHLQKSGYNVKGILSRTEESAAKYSSRFKIKNHSNNFNSITPGYKIFFLTVPDDQIIRVSKKLSKLKLNFKNSLFIHLSGTENLSALNSLKRKGAHTASFHIMQTFPSRKIAKIKKSYAAIETESNEAKKYLIKIAGDLKVIPFTLNGKQKSAYHLAGVFAANFLTGNLFSTERIMSEAGIKSVSSNRVMNPIIQSTLNNIKKSGPEKSLSGPVNRGDINTVKKHIKILKEISKKNDSDLSSKILYVNYLTQSLNLLEIVLKNKNKLNKNYNEIKILLINELKKIKF